MKPVDHMLRPSEHAALLLFRDNLEGGDPHCGMVSIKTVMALLARGLIRATVGDDREGYKRRHVPTVAGLAWLQARTHGPAMAGCAHGRHVETSLPPLRVTNPVDTLIA